MVTTAPPASHDEDVPPAYEDDPSSQPDELGITLSAQSSSHELLVSLAPPTLPRPGEKSSDQRAPLDLCLVIDAIDTGKNETTGLSVLDVVKHATRTIIESMSDKDRIAIVTFSDTAEVITSLTPMTKENRSWVWGEVDRLRTIGMTNLWHGLKTGMNVITGAAPGTATASDPFDDPADGQSELLSGHGQRLSAVFVLTDGQPNVEPPRGHIPMLKSYLGALPADSPKFTISTFGFGYSLDSRLLDEIADLGQGTYGFIPDSGMIGTVFIHAVANLMATWARGCVLDVELTKQDSSAQTQVEVLGALPVKLSGSGATIQVGDIQYGQSRDVVVKLPAQCFAFDPDYAVKVTASYSPHTLAIGAPSLQITQTLDRSHEVHNSVILHHEAYRLSFVRTVSELLKGCQRGRESKLDGSQLQQALANYTNDPLLKDYEPSTALTSDITSEVVLGLQSEHWSRWGEHYIPSLARSHQRQQCSNFKDPGLQMYGRDSPLFTSTRDAIDQTFDSLPPPKPSLANRTAYVSQSGVSRGFAMPQQSGAPPPAAAFQAQAFQSQAQACSAVHFGAASVSSAHEDEDDDMGFGLFSSSPPPGSFAPAARSARPARFAACSASPMPTAASSYAPVSSMAAYNSRSAPCFAGWCSVELGHGRKIKVSDLHRGTTVLTPTGISRVAAVLRTICPSGVANLCSVGALAVTPWHPIEHHGNWVFPANVREPELMPCDYVYSVLLEPSNDPNAHALCIEGVWCVTLGHGCTDSVRAHKFLGNYESVVGNLSQMKGYDSETGVVDGAGTVRNSNTGLVCGFKSPEVEDVPVWNTHDSLHPVACEA